MSRLSKKIHFFYHYCRHLLKKKGPNAIHSPFVFKLYYEVLKAKTIPHPILEATRGSFLADDHKMKITDFKTGLSSVKSITSIAKGSLTTAKFSLLLQRLITYLECQNLLETGTNLGINTQYMALAPGVNNVSSIEGNENLCSLASQNFTDEAKSKINLIHGILTNTLTPTLQTHNPDFIFMDADHTYQATRFCLDQIQKMERPPKCIVIHDIYWSPSMTKLWKEAIDDPSYTLTIDLFWAGLIFPERPMPKQHFNLGF